MSENAQISVFRLAFSMIRGINIGLAEKILSFLPDIEAFFTLSDDELHRLLNVRTSIVDSAYRRQLIDAAAKEYEFISKSAICPLFFSDDNFPKRLLNCEDAPVLLYTMGDANLNASKIVSIVGTRRATSYGQDMAHRIVSGLANEYGSEIIIVSGLAYGIDVAAHRAALECHIPTVSVMGHPLNTIYPADHRNVAIDIIRSGGALISEYPSSSAIHKGNFLQRNRIVAGLSDATLIVESDDKGGSMVTANIASAYNRDVFAVPGRASDRYSRGTNRLIYNNKAVLTRDADDIIEAMRWERKPAEGQQSALMLELSPEQSKTIDVLRQHPDYTVNELTRALGVSFASMTNILFELEMSDLIVSVPGNRYALTSLANDY